MLSGKEWLHFAGDIYLPDDVWLREKIAALFDAEELTASQQRLRGLADLGVTLLDLPARPNYAAELKAAALAEFGPPPPVNPYRPSNKPLFNLVVWLAGFAMVRILFNRHGGSL